MIVEHTNEFSRYKVLDTGALEADTDKAVAILRKVMFRNTKDGRPFLRLCFEDINGYIIIGRMFDITDMNTYGSVVSAMIGKLVLVEYTLDYFSGISLGVSCITPLKEDAATAYTKFFVGKYIQAESVLMSCNSKLLSRALPQSLEEFRQCYCNLDFLVGVSEETISKGLRGYILSIINDVLTVTSDVSQETVVAFLYAVVTWVHTRQEVDSSFDDNDMLFVASMMSRRVDTAGMGLHKLSNKISEFAALFTGNPKVISADTFKMYNLWKTLVEASNIAVLESRLPKDGFCSYRNYTIRRS